jgi:hypothetical protein
MGVKGGEMLSLQELKQAHALEDQVMSLHVPNEMTPQLHILVSVWLRYSIVIVSLEVRYTGSLASE